MTLFAKILDFMLPPTCPICGAETSEHGMLCHECWDKFNWIGHPKCSVCGYPFPADLDLGPRPLCPVCAIGANELDWIRSACVYDDWSKSIMLPFKHAGKIKYQKIMARAMISLLREFPDISSDLVVIPVPLAYRRLWKRGYNQATLLARPIAKHLGVRTDYNSIWRKHKPNMGHMTARQRAENVRGVFKVIKPENIRGKNILLVDDVMTSGGTFKALRRVLKRAGANKVYGITFCRTVRAI